MPALQFLRIRKLGEIAQTKMIERRTVSSRKGAAAPAIPRVPAILTKTPLHQVLQYAIDGHAAHSFDIGSRDRLPISNDGERFERGRAHAGRFGRRIKLLDPLCVVWIGRELPALRLLHQLKRPRLFDVFDFQLLECSCDLRLL